MKKIDISARDNTIYYETSAVREKRAMQLLSQHSGQIDVTAMMHFLSDDANREVPPTTEHGKSISNHGMTAGTVSAEVYDPAHRTFWYTYGWPDGDVRGGDVSKIGANTNTWGAWLPFELDKMTEPGFYTDRDGNLTALGVRYFASRFAQARLKSS